MGVGKTDLLSYGRFQSCTAVLPNSLDPVQLCSVVN